MIRTRGATCGNRSRLFASTLICLVCSIVAAQAQDHSGSGVDQQQFFPSLDRAAEMEREWRQIIQERPLRDAAAQGARRSKGDFWKPGEFDRILGR
jgi:hypothetical protein